MFLSGLRPTASWLFAAVLAVLGIVATSQGQQPAPGNIRTPGGINTPGSGRVPDGPRVPRRRPTPPTPPQPAQSLESQSLESPPLESQRLASLFSAGEGLPPIDALAGTPNMFGDLFAGGVQLAFSAPLAPISGTFDLPLAGGTRRLKVGENNSALVQDRVNLLYNHYHNAMNEDARDFVGDPAQRTLSVDRYTLGMEKALGASGWSVELLMPLAGETNFITDDVGIGGGNVGNLAVILKRIVYQCDCTVGSVGLGINTPTGSDVHGRVFATDFTVNNQAVYLAPYAAFLRQPTDQFFVQGFLELDIPTNGNRIDFQDPVNGSGTWGTLRDQTLLYADLSTGYWLYRNRCSSGLSGLASLFEVHYTTALENADSVTGFGNGTASRFSFGNLSGRSDVVNLTVGLHAELAKDTLCRVGCAVPLGTGAHRSFDSELQVQLERRF